MKKEKKKKKESNSADSLINGMIERQKEFMREKRLFRILNIISLSFIAFGIYSWFYDFRNWGGKFGLWIMVIALFLFAFAVISNNSGGMNRHEGEGE